MIDIQTVSVVIAASSVVLGVITWLYQNREMKEIQQTSLFMQLFNHMADERFDRAWKEFVWHREWTDLDNYLEKYGPEVNPEADSSREFLMRFYSTVGLLVKRGLIDIDLVYEMMPTGMTRFWDKIETVVKEFRECFNYPSNAEWIEYLANEMEKLRIKRGIPHPTPIIAAEARE